MFESIDSLDVGLDCIDECPVPKISIEPDDATVIVHESTFSTRISRKAKKALVSIDWAHIDELVTPLKAEESLW